METVLYQRIKSLCSEHSMTINKLESELGFSPSSIQKWKTINSPSVNKVIEVAKYFDVSVDYLLGITDIRGSADDILGDSDIISIQRAREKMPEQDKEKLMQMLKIGFDYAFNSEDKKK